MNPLNIGVIRSVNFYDQTAILLLMILNRLFCQKIEDCHSGAWTLPITTQPTNARVLGSPSVEPVEPCLNVGSQFFQALIQESPTRFSARCNSRYRFWRALPKSSLFSST